MLFSAMGQICAGQRRAGEVSVLSGVVPPFIVILWRGVVRTYKLRCFLYPHPFYHARIFVQPQP